MNMRKILVATDFSPDSEDAVDAALALAQRTDARVTLLHVCEPPPYSTPALGMYVPSPELMADVIASARRALELRKARCATRGAVVDTALVVGAPAAEIVRYASDRGFDLVVVGAHGGRGFRRFMLGSVAEAVVRTADRPVLTTHGHLAAAAGAA